MVASQRSCCVTNYQSIIPNEHRYTIGNEKSARNNDQFYQTGEMSVVDTYFFHVDPFRRAIHIVQAILVLVAFIVGCVLLSDNSMPRSRSTTLILVYVSWVYK